MYKEVKVAYDYADKIFANYSGYTVKPTKEEAIILDKFIEAGLIQLVKKKRGNLSRQLYFPTMEAEEFRGLSSVIWLKVIQHFIRKYGIDSKIGPASRDDYLSRYWHYNIEPVVVNKTAAGRLQIKEEEEALKKIIEE